jgi:transcriptional regulator with GAF, ATPase, and Fis domain
MTKSPAKSLSDCVAKIVRSEDLKTSIRALYSFFQEQIPLDYITMLVYDAPGHILQYRVHSTDSSIVLVDELIRFSEDTRRDARDLIDRRINTLYIPNGTKHPLVRQFDSYVGIDQPASIVMHQTEIAPHQYAILSLVVWGEDRYGPKHVRLVKNLSESIDSAVRHIFSQLVIARLRERLASDNREIRKRLGQNMAHDIAGLKEVMLRIDQVAKLDTPVLLMGETGVGKELMANAIHRRSRRSEGPLVSINCGGITETLIDSELFGPRERRLHRGRHGEEGGVRAGRRRDDLPRRGERAVRAGPGQAAQGAPEHDHQARRRTEDDNRRRARYRGHEP